MDDGLEKRGKTTLRELELARENAERPLLELKKNCKEKIRKT